MMKIEFPLGLTLGEFRKLTVDHPDNAEVYVTAPNNAFYPTNHVIMGPVAAPNCTFPAILLKPKTPTEIP